MPAARSYHRLPDRRKAHRMAEKQSRVELRLHSHESEISLMPIDTALVGALHVEYLRERDLSGDEHLHHTLFQTSTIDALLEGKYEGDVSFAELEGNGDFGLGTFDALDGEMICLDGTFYQIRADGRAYAVDGKARTPFAVVTLFEPDVSRTLSIPMGFEGLCDYVDGVIGGRAVCAAIRVDGSFEYVKTRSVPRQRKPYPPLVEVVKDQPPFELYIDHEGDLRLEVPPDVGLPTPDQSAAKGETLDRIERE